MNSEDHFSHGKVFDSTDYGIRGDARTQKDSWRWKDTNNEASKL